MNHNHYYHDDGVPIWLCIVAVLVAIILAYMVGTSDLPDWIKFVLLS